MRNYWYIMHTWPCRIMRSSIPHKGFFIQCYMRQLWLSEQNIGLVHKGYRRFISCSTAILPMRTSFFLCVPAWITILLFPCSDNVMRPILHVNFLLLCSDCHSSPCRFGHWLFLLQLHVMIHLILISFYYSDTWW